VGIVGTKPKGICPEEEEHFRRAIIEYEVR